MDTLDTIIIRQRAAKRGRRGRRDSMYDWVKKNYRCDVCRGRERGALREKRGLKNVSEV